MTSNHGEMKRREFLGWSAGVLAGAGGLARVRVLGGRALGGLAQEMQGQIRENESSQIEQVDGRAMGCLLKVSRIGLDCCRSHSHHNRR